MVVSTPKTKRNPARLTAAVVLASCVGGAAILAASPAVALDGFDGGKTYSFNPSTGIFKTDTEGSALDGAIFEITVATDSVIRVGAFGAFDRIDPATWAFDSVNAHPDMTWDEYVAWQINEHNVEIEENRPAYDVLIAQRDAIDPIAAQAAIDAYDAAVAEAAPFKDAYDAAAAAATAHADEMAMLEALGADRTQEQTDRLAVLMGTWGDVQAARDDALAVYQPYGQAVSDLSAANAQGIEDLTALPEIEATIATFGDMTPWTTDSHGVDQGAFDTAMAAWKAQNNPKVARSLAQAACNTLYGLPLAPVGSTPGEFGGTEYTYLVASCDGAASAPIGSVIRSLTEIQAPEGFVLDGTTYVVRQTGETTLSWGDETLSIRDASLHVTNERIEEQPVEPEEPPVTPEEPPVTPEQPKPETPTLAQTGADGSSAVALGGIAALLAATGAALAFRRRTAE